MLPDVCLHFLAGLHIVKTENRILQPHIAGVLCLLLFTLLNVEIGLLQILENITLLASVVVDQNFVILKTNFPMVSGSQHQAEKEAQKQYAF